MNIITVSREFGSGGRELGKRLADVLEYDYYDKEIITNIADRKNMDAEYVEKVLDNHGWQNVPLTVRRSFATSVAQQTIQTDLLVEQKRVIENIAKIEKNFVIVGRNADVILKDRKPFNIFVCADMEFKINRCLECAGDGEKLSRREIEKNIRSIDKNRARVREIIAHSNWGERGVYHLIINTSEWDIKELALAVADYANHWFRRTR